MQRHDAIGRALSFAREETEHAIQALSILSDGPVKTALHEAALFASKRAF